MAIKQLTEEQINEWTLEQKDKLWYENVWKGDMPQLTIRSAITGMFLGGILSLTNLYIGIFTGWTLGVGITSVILSFSMFKIFASLHIGKEMTLLENNAMQSIATAAGYMASPMIASLAAYMLITGKVIPMYQTMIWMIFVAILGVLFAFPLKKRFINDEQLPFPEGRAAGIVMDNLHSEQGKEGIFKAKILALSGLTAALIEFLQSDKILRFLRLDFLKLPPHIDDFIYKFWKPAILGTQLKDLTIHLDTSIIMVAAGGLMGIKTGLSLIVGGILNYFILAPILIKQGIITEPGFKHITMWALWGGVAMMTTSSLYSFFSRPKIIVSAFKSLFNKTPTGQDILKDIELPIWVFIIGIPVIGGMVVFVSHLFFHVHFLLGILAIPLIFIFALIAVNSTGLTSITPTGALGKLTQLTFAGLAPGNITTNIMTAGITGEVAGNASNLLMDIKPGYMLGGKPRHQAMGHILGIIAGSVCSVPVFYMMFHGDISLFTSEKFPMPAAQIWKAVAEVLTHGLSFLHPTAQIAVVVGAVLGILFEVINKFMKGRFPISGVGMGLAFVLGFNYSLSMALGAFIFWFLQKKKNLPETAKKIFVFNQETVCAGAIAGGSIIGIILILLDTVL